MSAVTRPPKSDSAQAELCASALAAPEGALVTSVLFVRTSGLGCYAHAAALKEAPMSVPSTLILVRHAESEHHIRRLTGGWTQTPLTTLGHEQARRVATRLREELGDAPVRVFTSDLARSLQTAEHIAAAFGVDAIDDPRLREHNNGVAVDLTLAEAKERFPGVYDRPWDIDFRPFEGAETGREFYERVGGFLDALPVQGPVPIAVSHGGTILRLIAYWLRMPPEAVEQVGFATHTAALTVLQTGRYGERYLERMNDIAHLAGMEGWVSLAASVR